MSKIRVYPFTQGSPLTYQTFTDYATRDVILQMRHPIDEQKAIEVDASKVGRDGIYREFK